MSQWTSPGRIVTGLVSAAVIALALASATGAQRAQSLGLTRHGQLITAQDAGAADAVAAVAVSPGTPGQVLTVSDAGLPHWAAASGGSATQPTTLAAQARAEAQRRRGPVALLGTASTGITTASTADSTPSITAGSSGVVTYYSSQAGAYGSVQLGYSATWGVRGWYISGFGSTLRLGFPQGVNQTADFTTALASTGWHTLAWSVAADGTSVRYSLDGAAVTTATLSTTPLTPVARDVSDPVYVGTNNSSSGSSPAGVAYLALREAVTSDADLRLLAASPSSGAPADVVTFAWEWAAAAHVGVEVVRIDGRDYAPLGAPQWWMP